MGWNTKLIIVGLLIGLVFTAFMGVLLDMSTSVNFTIDQRYNESFNKYQNFTANIEEQQATIEGGDFDAEASDVAQYKDALIAGKQAQASGEIFWTFLWNMPLYLKIPISIIAGFVAIMIVMTTVAVTKLFLGRTP